MVERLSLDLTPKKGVTMWHVCLCLDATTGDPCYVTITTNPLEFDPARYKGQVVMHKTRSYNCALQVARYVRRVYEMETATRVHRSARPVEAMIGYACTPTLTYPPSYVRESINEIVRHIAATSIAALLREVEGGVNAARTRYIVYEVRSYRADGRKYVGRAVTNKMHSVERVWRQCPPDRLSLDPFPDVVHVKKCETREEAEKMLEGFHLVCSELWTRRPDPKYMRRVLRLNGAEIEWTADGTSAVRRYETVRSPVVVVGPHVYTAEQVRYCLERGEWYSGQFRRGTMPEATGPIPELDDGLIE